MLIPLSTKFERPWVFEHSKFNVVLDEHHLSRFTQNIALMADYLVNNEFGSKFVDKVVTTI
ncbi:uncharacterized protein PHALS_13566 [Plasmopara halstedii]|uniref:Uncharacterized protein n=1 Tax=Plasmopara halstedii TaxID=4781 RepID=A0A0P1AQ78_PLAHL|nr:uncharacterized protein PHALS_13566 [Plasmopara halstedii]CEG43366.1 hypothetical protein PHALS_13566 [Plasmopara halstedii]|eukprot:XP_024579735.1 hypothetical protein PHALS_13566 [Plasmopara halstedii]